MLIYIQVHIVDNTVKIPGDVSRDNQLMQYMSSTIVVNDVHCEMSVYTDKCPGAHIHFTDADVGIIRYPAQKQSPQQIKYRNLQAKTILTTHQCTQYQ